MPVGFKYQCPAPYRTIREAVRDGLTDQVPRRHCRWCGEPCGGRRQTFCGGTPYTRVRERGSNPPRWVETPGSGCVHEWMLRSTPSYMRSAVYQRDHGVCAACGVDTDALQVAVSSMPRVNTRNGTLQLRRLDADSRGTEVYRYFTPDFPVVDRAGALSALGFRGSELWSEGVWHADHVVPVEHGGGLCGLEGMQTLCAPCHRKKTSQQRRKLLSGQ